MVKNMRVILTAALKDRKGVSALEYGILAAAVLGVVGAAATTMGTELTKIFAVVTSALTAAAGS
jgi:Flp pilus assembly pilin Flp